MLEMISAALLPPTDLIVTAAAQVVADFGVGRRRRWRDFLWHAGLERRIFQHVVQTAVCPVAWNWLQSQQV